MDKTIKILKVSLLALVFTAGVISLITMLPIFYSMFFGALRVL